jgi:hypothetical protein
MGTPASPLTTTVAPAKDKETTAEFMKRFNAQPAPSMDSMLKQLDDQNKKDEDRKKAFISESMSETHERPSDYSHAREARKE